MSDRAQQLHATADAQLAALTELLSGANDTMLLQPCPRRQKLGDGTIGAVATHTVENYDRIAAFLATTGGSVPATSAQQEPSGHRMPRWLGRLGHQPPSHGPGMHNHDGNYTADSATLEELAERLSAARTELERIAQLTDQQLDIAPPKDSFRFCDGQRTLEQVIEGLLTHQDHQVQTLSTALGPRR